MSVIKIIELIGTSKKSWEDAAKEGFKRASKTIKGIKWMEIKNFNGSVKNQKLVEYQAHLKIAFEVK